jgi:serine/threonine protein kinase
MIMELACERHRTLAEVLTRPTAFTLRLELLRDVFEGLSVVHQLSVIYGDIKPENVLIFDSQDQKRIVAKLSDFGFCQPRHDYEWEAGGTPYWNAPECLRSAPQDLRHFAKSNLRDIYTFGLLSIFLLTEESPFADFRGDSEKIARFKLEDRVSDLLSAKWRLRQGSRNQNNLSTSRVSRKLSFFSPVTSQLAYTEMSS